MNDAAAPPPNYNESLVPIHSYRMEREDKSGFVRSEGKENVTSQSSTAKTNSRAPDTSLNVNIHHHYTVPIWICCYLRHNKKNND